MINALFIVTLFELFLGGGGRLIQIGPFTLRMLLFACCLSVGAVAIYFRLRRLDGQRMAFGLVLLYLLVHVFGLVVGGFKGAPASDMMTEFQQTLFWIIAPFFALVLQSPLMVYRVSWVVRISGLVLALAYFTVLALLAFGRLSILQVLPLLHDSGEVLVRADNFLFYKGFLYLGIGIIFFVALRGRFWVMSTGLIVVALVLTLTRGFILSTSIAVVLLLVAQGRRGIAAFAVIVVAMAAFVVFIYVPSQNKDVTEQRSISNSQRTMDFLQIVDQATPETLLLGEGYGALVNDRQNIENSFLWATWKLGLLGILFWLMPLGLCTYFYLKIPNRKHHGMAAAFLFGTVLVYVQTFTNPYLNNPIGLSFVIVAIFSLRTLAREARSREPHGAHE